MYKIAINTVIKHPYRDKDILITIVEKNGLTDALRELYSMIPNSQKKTLLDVLKSTYHDKEGVIVTSEEDLDVLSKVEIDIECINDGKLFKVRRSPLFVIKTKYITPKNSIFLYADISLGKWSDFISDEDMESAINEVLYA